MNEFRKQFFARWGDADSYGHMRNTAYMNVSGDVRMMFFAEHAFPVEEFEKMRIGPVIIRDEIEYFREIRLLEPFSVSLKLMSLSNDGSKFCLRNVFFKEGEMRAAQVTSLCAWLDLASRKLCTPPEGLTAVLNSLPKSSTFRVLGK